MAISKALAGLLRGTFRLQWDGFHGVAHWARVRDHGLRLAAETGANPAVVEYFAFLHDACRHNEGGDPDHGARAARLAMAVRREHIALDAPDFDRLVWALEGHTSGTHTDEVTVATCWDADRLDLGRVDIVPDPRFLLTEPARRPGTIDRAWRRSIAWREKYLERKWGA
jgi:uncharacterized protein